MPNWRDILTSKDPWARQRQAWLIPLSYLAIAGSGALLLRVGLRAIGGGS